LLLNLYGRYLFKIYEKKFIESSGPLSGKSRIHPKDREMTPYSANQYLQQNATLRKEAEKSLPAEKNIIQ